MRRLLLCLPLCLLLAPEPAPDKTPIDPDKTHPVVVGDKARLVGFGTGCWTVPYLYPLPDDAKMEDLAKNDPVAFFQACVRRYDREVSAYTCVLDKTERLDGQLQPAEEIAIYFREQPFSALLEWQKGARLAKRSLYVRGENKDKLLVLPNGKLLSLAGVVERDVDSASAKSSGRYLQSDFGIKIGTERTIVTWEAAKKNKALHTEYLGIKKVPELANRSCYVIKRAPFDKPEEDGVTEVVLYIDKETWLQTGSLLKGADGLIGAYYFRDVKINPDFKPDTFTRKALSR